MNAPDLFDVGVRGGSLRVARWGSSGPVVLAIHGITATLMEWPLLATKLDGVRLVAPDLRGRGDSAHLPGPYGMDQHAEDCVAILDHLGEDRAIVVGHSMGGYVAAVMAAKFPERVSSLVLVDGGLRLADLPAGSDVDAILAAVIGPALERLKTTFPSREAYLDFWRAHPALRDWSEHVEAYVAYDLTGEEPELHSKCSLEATREDGADVLQSPLVGEAVGRVTCPVVFLRAERGMFDDPVGLYPDEAMAGWADRVPHMRQVTVPDVNHYTIVIGDAGAETVAAHVREAVAR